MELSSKLLMVAIVITWCSSESSVALVSIREGLKAKFCLSELVRG